MHVQIHMCLYICLYIDLHVLCMIAFIYVLMYPSICIHIYLYISIYIYIYLYIYTCIIVFVYVYIHIACPACAPTSRKKLPDSTHQCNLRFKQVGILKNKLTLHFYSISHGLAVFCTKSTSILRPSCKIFRNLLILYCYSK